VSFKLVFDPITGQFEFKRVSGSTTVVSGGGGTINFGTLIIPSGTQVTFQNELTLDALGEILLESGADLIIE